jgi:hypothetical protein
MPDITMCQGFDCEDKSTCYRYTASPNVYRQSYFLGLPIDDTGNCAHYLKDTRSPKEKKQARAIYLKEVENYNAWHIANGTPDFVPIVP